MGRAKSKGNPPLLAALETAADAALTLAESKGWKKWEGAYLERGAKPAQAIRLAKAAAALETVAHVAALGGVPRRKEVMYRALGRLLAAHGVRSIPTNWRRLAEKCAAVLAGASIPSLIKPKNVGNQNARKTNARKRPAKRKTRARLDDSNTLTDPPTEISPRRK